MTWVDYLFFINFAFMIFSGWLAFSCFKEENIKAGWINLFASALNGAVFLDHFL